MQDEPDPAELLAAVAAFLRDVVAAEASARTAFQARVAAKAVDLVARQIAAQAETDDAERLRLVALLGRDGPLESLNEALACAIAAGTMTLETAGLADHLRLTTLAKLAVDQPGYAGYCAALAERAAPPEET